MKTISPRSTATFGALMVLMAAALAGCATTGGATSGLATSNALATKGTVPTNNSICVGGHASRFPQREALGRVCMPSPLLNAIY